VRRALSSSQGYLYTIRKSKAEQQHLSLVTPRVQFSGKKKKKKKKKSASGSKGQ
jgi:hypothetical protein